MESSESNIIERAIKGDEKAFTIVYKQYRQEIFYYFNAAIGHKEDALDLTADVFLAVLHSINSFKNESSFKTWLFAIAKHKLMNYYSKKYRTREMYVDDDAEDVIDESDEPDFNIGHDLKIILTKLKPLDREILTLISINELSYKECAEILNIQETNARVIHHRALKNAKMIANSYK